MCKFGEIAAFMQWCSGFSAGLTLSTLFINIQFNTHDGVCIEINLLKSSLLPWP